MELKLDGTSYPVKYMHYRIRTKEGIKSNGGMTVAFIEPGEPIAAIANCSLKDTYSKKLGRMIAAGRLQKLI